MKKQRKLFVVVAVMMLVSLLKLNGYGQNQGSQRNQHLWPPPLPTEKQLEQQISTLSEELKLSEEQEKQVGAIFKAHFAELKLKQEKEKAKRKEQHKEMEAYRKAFENEVKDVLTSEQQVQFDELMKKQRPPHQKEGREKN